MASSPVSICNSALIKVGADRITSLTEDTQRARLVNEQYNKCRKELLRSHPWNFATKRTELAALVQEPEYEYSYQFQLPADCLRVLKTNLYSDEPFKIEGRLLLCDSNTIKILYIKDETDTSKFDASFDETLALRIAADIAYTLSGSATLANGLMEAYKYSLKDARSFDAQEGSADRIIADEWLVTRY
jgi:hypothetical protein